MLLFLYKTLQLAMRIKDNGLVQYRISTHSKQSYLLMPLSANQIAIKWHTSIYLSSCIIQDSYTYLKISHKWSRKTPNTTRHWVDRVGKFLHSPHRLLSCWVHQYPTVFIQKQFTNLLVTIHKGQQPTNR